MFNYPGLKMADFWNDSLSGYYLWSNTNFGEAVTETMTPLTWSVLRFTLEDWIFIPGFRTVGNIGGSPYLNISIFASLFKALGQSQEKLLKTMESTLNLRLPPEVEIPLLPRKDWKLLPALLAVLRVGSKQRMGLYQAHAYVRQNPSWFQQMRDRLQATKEPSALKKLWQDEIRLHVKMGAWCTLGSVTHAADYTMSLRNDLIRLVGEEDASLLISNLSEVGSILPSLGLAVGLSQVVSGELERETYLDRYGHRGPHEFELSVAPPAENPTWLEQQIVQYRRDGVDVQAFLERQHKAQQAAWDRLVKRHPGRARELNRRLEESARRAWLREEVRSAYTRDRWLVRLFAKRAGELSGLGEGVFFIALEELLDVLSGNPAPVELIAQRKREYAALKALPVYPPIIVGKFDPFSWAADPSMKSELYTERPAVLSDSAEGAIRGTPGSVGVVEGVVRVLHSLEEAGALQQGEILVTTFTDIGWTPLFPRAAAVVTDVGALLSHAAIVARELGIPAVVGCGDATRRLQTGDTVRVDGVRGEVRKINHKHRKREEIR